MTIGYWGGALVDPAAPPVVLIHGAGLNHTAWRFQTRYLAHHGRRVLAVDLPGHGSNREPRLDSIEGMAEWVATKISEHALAKATVVGHSMGGLIALEVSATNPDMVKRVVLLGTATEIAVAPALQAAADAKRPEAIAMIIGWSYPHQARLGGHLEPGLWQTGVSARLIERELVNLGPDLAATNAYRGGRKAASRLRVASLLIAGRRDRMVSAAATSDLAAAINKSQLEILPDAGHMMLTDSPEAIRRLLAGFIPSA